MIRTLNILWRKKKSSLSKTLQKGITEIASILLPISAENNLSQKISGNEIQWRNSQDKIVTLFFYLKTPGNCRM